MYTFKYCTTFHATFVDSIYKAWFIHLVIMMLKLHLHYSLAAPCRDNTVSCQDGVCTCKTGFGGPDCCQCRDNAVANSCTDTACECQEGYAAPTCCDCVDDFYRASDGTCKSMWHSSSVMILHGIIPNRIDVDYYLFHRNMC